MVYMAVSLAITAGGHPPLLPALHVAPGRGQDDERGAGRALRQRLRPGGLPARAGCSWWLTLLAEAALLFVAAQTGFIDGPRVMANMAHDSLAAAPLRLSSPTGSPCRTACCSWAARVARRPSSTPAGTSTHLVIDVLDQRLRHLLALPARHAALLGAASAAARRLASTHIVIHVVGLAALPRPSSSVTRLREVRARAAGSRSWSPACSSGLCFLIRRHYREVAAEPEAARRDPGPRCPRPTGETPSRSTRRLPRRC